MPVKKNNKQVLIALVCPPTKILQRIIFMLLFNRTMLAALFAAGLALLPPSSAIAQTTANVTVNAGTSLNKIPSGAFGVNTAVWDGYLLDPAIPALLSKAGINALRYPGGSTADVYNWQTNSIVTGQGGYANPSNTFDAFMGMVKNSGATPIITVNYGSNAAGNGGGTPSFAASWVQYANVTKGYGVKYWEVGNEVYGNGGYGSSWETDLHSARDPATYGANVALFASAMKAVDPTIKVGVVLTAPGNWPDGQTPSWNSTVLAKCGSAIDFVIVHWYPQNPGSESDSGLLASPQSGFNGSPGIAGMVSSVKSLINQYGGSNASKIQIFVTEMNSVSTNPGKQTISVVNAMFVADGLLTWLENGAANVDIWSLHNGSTGGNMSSSLFGSATYGDYGILSNATSGEPAADTPAPTYFGMQMLTNLGKAGDTLVSAASSNSLLTAHAVKQANGNLALLLINKDPNYTTTANVAVSGYTPAATGTSYTFGKSSSAIASASATGLGSSFKVTAQPYSLTTVVLTPGSTSPGFSLSGSVANLSIKQSGSGSSTITVAPSGGFAGAVSFAASGLQSGVTASFSPTSSTGSTTLTLSAGSSAAIGTATVTITGKSGSLTSQTKFTLTVNAPAVANFSLSATPASVSLAQGASATSSISIAPAGGFNSSVALSISGLPSGVTASFSPATTASTSTLTLNASGTASTGNSTATITGAGGSLSHTATLALSVNTASSSGGSATFAGNPSANGPWYDEDDVTLTTTTPITALTLTITVPAANVTYNSSYNTVGSAIVTSHASGANIVYTFTLASGQSIGAGSYTFAAQLNGNGTTHNAASDTWSVTYTSGGATYTKSGSI
jgi:hypothetical protein